MVAGACSKDDTRDPVARMMVENYRSLYESQTAMKERAEKASRDAKKQMIRVVTALCPIVLERIRRQDSDGVDDLSIKELADLAIDEVKYVLDETYFAGGVDYVVRHRRAREEVARLKEKLAVAESQGASPNKFKRVKKELEAATAELQAVKEEAGTLQKALGVIRAELADVKERNKMLEQMVRDLQDWHQAKSTPTASTTAPTSDPPAVIEGPRDNGAEADGTARRRFEPEWVTDWRKSRAFKNDSRVILVLGSTGECRRPQLIHQIAGQYEDLNPQSGTFGRVFSRLDDKGLIEVTDVNPRISGNRTSLIELTSLGRDAYRALTQRDPLDSLLGKLLARHKSPEHTYLNLEAADILEGAGFHVELLPEPRTVSVGKFEPDLQAISPEGKSLWVEVECDTGKNAADRVRKWEIYYAASEGHFVIVTDNKSAMQNIQSEVMSWIHARSLILWMTNVSDLLSGERPKTENGIWFVKREL